MMTYGWRKTARCSRESGQALVFMVLALSIFLLGAGALSVDMSNLWFHRQAAQNAADAACTAGAMDMLVYAQSPVDTQATVAARQGFTPGTAFSCTGSTAPLCKYASMNGYNSDGASPGNLVSVSFPTSASMSSVVPSAALPPSALASNAFMRVDVNDNVPTYFSGLLSGGKSQLVRAFAVCGLVVEQSPVPLLILAPTGTSLSSGGASDVTIVGGPQRSIQVNSSDRQALSGGINLSQGGPAQPPTGSDIGVFGGPAAKPNGVAVGSTGHYFSPSAPIPDPFALIPAPQIPTHAGTKTAAGNGVNGCLDSGGCDEYSPGYYSATLWPNGIDVKQTTAIFDPGIYYIAKGGLTGDTQGCLFPSTATGDGSGGTMFYFADTNSFSAGSNSGKTNKCPSMSTTMSQGSLPFGIKCTAASVTPSNVPGTVSTMLLAPCRIPNPATGLCAPNCGLNYGDPLGTTNPIGEQRGMLFFQNRSQKAEIDFGGGGVFLFSGAVYIHQCVTGGADTGTGCSSGAYGSQWHARGGGGSGTIIGQIVIDSVNLNGNESIKMDLNSGASFGVLKATLLR